MHMPTSTAGKWSVGLNALFLIVVAVSCTLVLLLKVLDFGDTWWDITMAIIVPTVLLAMILGLVAVSKYKDRSVLVYCSIAVGVAAILFGLLHSLFIND